MEDGFFLDEDGELDPFWGTEGNRPLNVSELQAKFVYLRLKYPNLSNTDAARRAGSKSEKKETLAAAASRIAHSPKVRALMQMAMLRNDSEENEIAPPEEILQMLSREMRRGKNPTSQMRAAEILARYHNLMEGGRGQFDTMPTEGLLNILSDESPHWTACSLILANQFSGSAEPDDMLAAAWRPSRFAWIELCRVLPDLAATLEDMGIGGFKDGASEVSGTEARGAVDRPGRSGAAAGSRVAGNGALHLAGTGAPGA